MDDGGEREHGRGYHAGVRAAILRERLGKELIKEKGGSEIWSAAFSADGTMLAVGINEAIELYSLDRAKDSGELQRSDP